MCFHVMIIPRLSKQEATDLGLLLNAMGMKCCFFCPAGKRNVRGRQEDLSEPLKSESSPRGYR